MNPKDISQAKSQILRGSVVAMKRAASMARELAIRTDTYIVRADKDGKPVRISAEQLRKERDARGVSA